MTDRQPKQRGHDQGTIGQRANGRWVAAASIGWTAGPDGKPQRQRKDLYGKRRKEVAEKPTQALSDQPRGLPMAVVRQTVAQFLDTWHADTVHPRVRPKTYQSAEEIVRFGVLPWVYLEPTVGLKPATGALRISL